MENLTLVGKITGKTEDGKATLEVGQDVDVFHVEEGDSFVTLEVTPGGYLALFGDDEG